MSFSILEGNCLDLIPLIEGKVDLTLKYMISKEEIEKIINSIKNEYEPDKIILFGSYSTGLANEDSDLDLLIIKDSDKTRVERGLEIKKLLRKYKMCFPIDLLIYTPEELMQENLGKNSFINNVLEEGKVVYERT